MIRDTEPYGFVPGGNGIMVIWKPGDLTLICDPTDIVKVTPFTYWVEASGGLEEGGTHWAIWVHDPLRDTTEFVTVAKDPSDPTWKPTVVPYGKGPKDPGGYFGDNISEDDFWKAIERKWKAEAEAKKSAEEAKSDPDGLSQWFSSWIKKLKKKGIVAQGGTPGGASGSAPVTPSSLGGRPDVDVSGGFETVVWEPGSSGDDFDPRPEVPTGPVGPTGPVDDPGPVYDPSPDVEIDDPGGPGETTIIGEPGTSSPNFPGDGAQTGEGEGSQTRDEGSGEGNDGDDGDDGDEEDEDGDKPEEGEEGDEENGDESGFAFDDGGPILGGGGAEGFDPNELTSFLLNGRRRPKIQGYGPSFADLAGFFGGEGGYDDVPTVTTGVAREGFADRVGIDRLTGGDPDANGGGDSFSRAVAIAKAYGQKQKQQEGFSSGTDEIIARLGAVRPGFDVGETGGDPDRIDEFDHRGMLAPVAAAAMAQTSSLSMRAKATAVTGSGATVGVASLRRILRGS